VGLELDFHLGGDPPAPWPPSPTLEGSLEQRRQRALGVAVLEAWYRLLDDVTRDDLRTHIVGESQEIGSRCLPLSARYGNHSQSMTRAAEAVTRVLVGRQSSAAVSEL
jgi:hypothetical protein